MANLQIPHKFAGLEPAVANEVNENFEAMKAYTIALQTELNAINETLAELDKKPVREVFAIYPSVSSKTPTGAYPLWTGETITNARTLFPAFWQECLNRKSSGTIKTVVSNADYDAIVEEHSQCSSFFIDELNGHIRLPMMTRFISSLTTSSELGQMDGAGLPELTGLVSSALGRTKKIDSEGALSYESTSGQQDGGDGGDGEPIDTINIKLTASEGNAIYGNSETVQPEAMRVCWYIQVATNVADIAEMDLETIANELAKATAELQAEYDSLSVEMNALYSQLSSQITVLAGEKKSEFNTNALEKTNDFNTNYDEKIVVVNNEVAKAENAATEAQRIADDLGAIISFKGRVDTVSDLPSSGNKTGDAYFVGLVSSSQKEEYVWDSTRWELFGVSSGSLSDYYTKEQTDALLEENYEKTVFSINEASKDASGNLNFMSVSGNQITFNGAVKYTQANGESKEYANVSSIALTNGYVMLNNGVASVVPALEVQQNEPVGDVWEQPNPTENGTRGVGDYAFYASSSYTSQPTSQPYKAARTTINNGAYENWHSQVPADYPEWWAMWTKQPININELTVYNRTSGATHSIKNCVVQVSNDGENWVDIHSFENINNVVNSSWTVEIPKYSGFYTDFRLLINTGYDTSDVIISNILFKANIQATNQTVWFNPYNNQAKQYNSSDWVDYNGVPVGEVSGDIAYNYQYNTQKGLNPSTAKASPEEKAEVVSWGIPDYGAGVPISRANLNTEPFIAPCAGVVKGAINPPPVANFRLLVNGSVVGAGDAYITSINVEMSEGDVLSSTTSLDSDNNNYSFYPLKGAI